MQTDKAHLLIVEDDDQLAELLLEYLGQHGFKLSRMASGDGAAETILETQPDLVQSSRACSWREFALSFDGSTAAGGRAATTSTGSSRWERSGSTWDPAT